MDTALIVARTALIGVFALAAVAKLADQAGSRAALEGFRVPSGAVPAGAIGLPVTELLAALLLIPAATVQAGAALTCVLLLLFVGGIAAAIRRGTAPECHCFGQLHSRPAGHETLLRNGVLLAVGLFVAIGGPGPSFSGWADGGADRVALAATGLLAAGLALACLSLWRENRRLSGRAAPADLPTPLSVGEAMPDFKVTDAHGERLTADDLLDATPTVLVFTSATCGPCHALMPELSQWRKMLKGRLAIQVLASGDKAENQRIADKHDIPVFVDRDGAAAISFGILGTPSAVEVDARGLIATSPVAGAPAIEGLIRAALKRPAASPSPTPVGQADGGAAA